MLPKLASAVLHDLAVGLERDVIYLSGAANVYRGETAAAEFHVQAAVGIEAGQAKRPGGVERTSADRSRGDDLSIWLNRDAGATRRTLGEGNIHLARAAETGIRNTIRVIACGEHRFALEVPTPTRTDDHNLGIGLERDVCGNVRGSKNAVQIRCDAALLTERAVQAAIPVIAHHFNRPINGHVELWTAGPGDKNLAVG